MKIFWNWVLGANAVHCLYWYFRLDNPWWLAVCAVSLVCLKINWSLKEEGQ